MISSHLYIIFTVISYQNSLAFKKGQMSFGRMGMSDSTKYVPKEFIFNRKEIIKKYYDISLLNDTSCTWVMKLVLNVTTSVLLNAHDLTKIHGNGSCNSIGDIKEIYTPNENIVHFGLKLKSRPEVQFCSRRRSGDHCVDYADHCKNDRCFNYGTCLNTKSGFFCLCHIQYTGKRCETETDSCELNPCMNNGTCFDTLDIDYYCICPDGFMGEQCSTVGTEAKSDCSQHPCLNKGYCVDIFRGFLCHCRTGFKGRTCQHAFKQECPDHTLTDAYKKENKNTILFIGLFSIQGFVVILASILFYCIARRRMPGMYDINLSRSRSSDRTVEEESLQSRVSRKNAAKPTNVDAMGLPFKNIFKLQEMKWDQALAKFRSTADLEKQDKTLQPVKSYICNTEEAETALTLDVPKIFRNTKSEMNQIANTQGNVPEARQPANQSLEEILKENPKGVLKENPMSSLSTSKNLTLSPMSIPETTGNMPDNPMSSPKTSRNLTLNPMSSPATSGNLSLNTSPVNSGKLTLGPGSPITSRKLRDSVAGNSNVKPESSPPISENLKVNTTSSPPASGSSSISSKSKSVKHTLKSKEKSTDNKKNNPTWNQKHVDKMAMNIQQNRGIIKQNVIEKMAMNNQQKKNFDPKKIQIINIDLKKRMKK